MALLTPGRHTRLGKLQLSFGIVDVALGVGGYHTQPLVKAFLLPHDKDLQWMFMFSAKHVCDECKSRVGQV